MNTVTTELEAIPGHVVTTVIEAKETQSPSIDQVIPAMGLAWAKFPKIPRNAVGKVYKDGKHQYDWKYATLDDVYDAIKPHLVENGLFLMHRIVQVEGEPGIWLFTQLWHGESQQWIGQWQRLADSGSAQQFGGQLTYKMRYGTCALLSVVPADDDDANAASGQEMHREDRRQHQAPQRGAKPAGGQGEPPRQPAGGASPKPASSPPAPPESGPAVPDRLAKPASGEALAKKINDLATIEEVATAVSKLVGYQGVAQSPQLWPTMLNSIHHRLANGVELEDWDAEATEDAHSEMLTHLTEIATSGIDEIHRPEALAKWLKLFLDDYWNADGDHYRDLEQWRAILRYAVNRSAKGLKDEGWDAATCDGPLAAEIKRHKLAIKQLAESLIEDQQNDAEETDATQDDQAGPEA